MSSSAGGGSPDYRHHSFSPDHPTLYFLTTDRSISLFSTDSSLPLSSVALPPHETIARVACVTQSHSLHLACVSRHSSSHHTFLRAFSVTSDSSLPCVGIASLPANLSVSAADSVSDSVIVLGTDSADVVFLRFPRFSENDATSLSPDWKVTHLPENSENSVLLTHVTRSHHAENGALCIPQYVTGMADSGEVESLSAASDKGRISVVRCLRGMGRVAVGFEKIGVWQMYSTSEERPRLLFSSTYCAPNRVIRDIRSFESSGQVAVLFTIDESDQMQASLYEASTGVELVRGSVAGGILLSVEQVSKDFVVSCHKAVLDASQMSVVVTPRSRIVSPPSGSSAILGEGEALPPMSLKAGGNTMVWVSDVRESAFPGCMPSFAVVVVCGGEVKRQCYSSEADSALEQALKIGSRAIQVPDACLHVLSTRGLLRPSGDSPVETLLDLFVEKGYGTVIASAICETSGKSQPAEFLSVSSPPPYLLSNIPEVAKWAQRRLDDVQALMADPNRAYRPSATEEQRCVSLLRVLERVIAALGKRFDRAMEETRAKIQKMARSANTLLAESELMAAFRRNGMTNPDGTFKAPSFSAVAERNRNSRVLLRECFAENRLLGALDDHAIRLLVDQLIDQLVSSLPNDARARIHSYPIPLRDVAWLVGQCAVDGSCAASGAALTILLYTVADISGVEVAKNIADLNSMPASLRVAASAALHADCGRLAEAFADATSPLADLGVLHFPLLRLFLCHRKYEFAAKLLALRPSTPLPEESLLDVCTRCKILLSRGLASLTVLPMRRWLDFDLYGVTRHRNMMILLNEVVLHCLANRSFKPILGAPLSEEEVACMTELVQVPHPAAKQARELLGFAFGQKEENIELLLQMGEESLLRPLVEGAPQMSPRKPLRPTVSPHKSPAPPPVETDITPLNLLLSSPPGAIPAAATPLQAARPSPVRTPASTHAAVAPISEPPETRMEEVAEEHVDEEMEEEEEEQEPEEEEQKPKGRKKASAQTPVSTYSLRSRAASRTTQATATATPATATRRTPARRTGRTTGKKKK